jgi:hypothetical protein
MLGIASHRLGRGGGDITEGHQALPAKNAADSENLTS